MNYTSMLPSIKQKGRVDSTNYLINQVFNLLFLDLIEKCIIFMSKLHAS